MGRELYSDYIESQAKEFRHQFLSGWKFVNTLGQTRVIIQSSLVRKMTWQHLHQLLEKGKRLDAMAMLKIEVDLRDHEPYN